MKSRKILAAASILLAIGASTAQASTSPSWNYVEAYYGSVNYDDLGKSLHGYSASGVAALNDRFFMSVNIANAERNIQNSDVDVTQLALGVGAKWSGVTISQKPTDVFVQVYRGEETAKVSSVDSFDKLNADFWSAEAGFRVMATPELELGMSLQHMKYDDVPSEDERETGVQASIRYFVAPHCALNAKASRNSSVDQFGVGVSYSF